MTKLDDYLKKRESEFEKIQQELDFLRKIKIPLEIQVYEDGKNGLDRLGLFSKDYTLAEKFRIEMRNDWGQSSSGYDGSYSEETRKWYPQFYFYIKAGNQKKVVQVQHEGFDKDDRMIIRAQESSRGSGREYGGSEYNWQKDLDVNQEKAYDYFRKLGVKEPLIKKIESELKRRDRRAW